jgi:hypothetical protein
LKVQAQGGILEDWIAANGTGLAAGALKDLREALEAAFADRDAATKDSLRDAATKDRDLIQKKLDDVIAELKKVCAA